MDNKEEYAFWDRYYLESPLKDIEVVDNAARQLITITSLLQGIYFATISLTDFKKQAAPWQLALLLAPAVLWLLGLVFAVITFMPTSHSISRDSAREDWARIAGQKFRMLRISYYILLASLVVLLANVVVYLLWLQAFIPTAPAP